MMPPGYKLVCKPHELVRYIYIYIHWGPKLTIFFGHMAEVAKRSKKTCRIQQNPKRPKKMAGTRNMDFLRFPWVLFQGPNCRPH